MEADTCLHPEHTKTTSSEYTCQSYSLAGWPSRKMKGKRLTVDFRGREFSVPHANLWRQLHSLPCPGDPRPLIYPFDTRGRRAIERLGWNMAHDPHDPIHPGWSTGVECIHTWTRNPRFHASSTAEANCMCSDQRLLTSGTDYNKKRLYTMLLCFR